MNTYLASSIASDHYDRLLAESVASRRAREARMAHRAHRADRAPTKRSVAHRAVRWLGA
jgi:hypothetical protein